jgi:hypothetical protein
MNDEQREIAFIHHSSFLIHPSSLLFVASVAARLASVNLHSLPRPARGLS